MDDDEDDAPTPPVRGTPSADDFAVARVYAVPGGMAAIKLLCPEDQGNVAAALARCRSYWRQGAPE